MTSTTFLTVPMTEIPTAIPDLGGDWLWDGYLARGNVTLLTSQWKTGKTTLLAGLLRNLGTGEPFLGRPLGAGRAMVVSEEAPAHWADRLRRMPIGPHAHLLARPFAARPTAAEFAALIDAASAARLDLFVIDPMVKFLPGAWESNAGVLIDAVEPLHRLTAEGTAVLLLHHPRKEPSEPGHSARGTGALLGFVDISLELTRFGRLRSDHCRRQIVALSRHPRTPERLVYEWDPDTGLFTALGDPAKDQFERNWTQVVKLLEQRTAAATHKELLDDWPADQGKPSAGVLYEWLNRGFAEKRVRREGKGTRPDPWRYRLENEDDWYYDRGELPPLKPLIGPRGK